MAWPVASPSYLEQTRGGGPFVYGTDWYVVGGNSNDGKVTVWKNTDPENNSWTSPDSANRPIPDSGYAVWFVTTRLEGSELHIAYLEYDAGNPTLYKYSTFDLDTDTYDLDEEVYSSDRGSRANCDIAVRSDGTVVYFLMHTYTTMGSDYSNAAYAIRDGSWGSTISVTGDATITKLNRDLIQNGDRCHFFWRDTSGVYKLRTLSSADSLSSAITLTDDISNWNTSLIDLPGASIDGGVVSKVISNYNDEVAELRFTSSDTPASGTFYELFTLPKEKGSATPGVWTGDSNDESTGAAWIYQWLSSSSTNSIQLHFYDGGWSETEDAKRTGLSDDAFLGVLLKVEASTDVYYLLTEDYIHRWSAGDATITGDGDVGEGLVSNITSTGGVPPDVTGTGAVGEGLVSNVTGTGFSMIGANGNVGEGLISNIEGIGYVGAEYSAISFGYSIKSAGLSREALKIIARMADGTEIPVRQFSGWRRVDTDELSLTVPYSNDIKTILEAQEGNLITISLQVIEEGSTREIDLFEVALPAYSTRSNYDGFQVFLLNTAEYRAYRGTGAVHNLAGESFQHTSPGVNRVRGVPHPGLYAGDLLLTRGFEGVINEVVYYTSGPSSFLMEVGLDG